MSGALLWFVYAVVLGLATFAAFWLFRSLLAPVRDFRAGRRTPSGMALVAGCIAFIAAAMAAALIGAQADGMSAVDLLLLRRIWALDSLAGRTPLWPERIVFTLYAACAIALAARAFFRRR